MQLHKHIPRIIVLGIRVLTIGIRFLFNLLIIRDLNLEEYGTYAIFYTSISLSVILIGLDYYYYNTREIIKANFKQKRSLLGDQLILHLCSHLIFIPLSLFFLSKFIPTSYLAFFYFILFFEHLSQEGYRLFIAYSKPILANIIQFIKMAFWCLIVLCTSLIKLESIAINLSTIFKLWLIFTFLSTVIIGYLIRKYNYISIRFSKDTFKRIGLGLKVSLLFFLSTLMFKFIEYASRYFLDFFTSKEEVGVFIFFSNISNLIYVSVHTVSIIILYPQLIKSFNDRDIQLFIKLKKRLINEIIGISLIISTLIIILTPYLLKLINKQELQNNYLILIILLISTMIFMLSYYPHYMLYLSGKDKQLLIASGIASFFTLILNMTLTKYYGMIGAAIATLSGFSILFFVKYYFYKKLTPIFQE